MAVRKSQVSLAAQCVSRAALMHLLYFNYFRCAAGRCDGFNIRARSIQAPCGYIRNVRRLSPFRTC